MARGLIGVIVTAQMAIAAYACPATSPTPRADMAARSSSVPMARMVHCDDMTGSTDPALANLCAEHCKYGQQSDQAPRLNVPAAMLTVLYVDPTVPEFALSLRAAAASMSAPVAASPPHAILHCVYRI